MATYESKKYKFSGANINNVAATAIADGSVTDSEYQFINTLASNAQTQLSARLPLAGGTMTGNTTFNDNIEARFGNSADLKIRHDGNNSQLVDTGAGALEILTDEFKIKNAADSETMMLANENGSVALYHDNTARVTTSGSGATINGTLSATTGSFTNVSGNGSSLTNLPAGNLTGTVADARISTLTASKLTGALPAIDGSALTGISNSPSAGGIGDIKPFLLMRSSGSGGSTSLSAGTTFTPSSYTASNMLVADYGTSVQLISITSNTQKYGALNGYASLSQHVSGSSSGSGGTWRVIFPLISGSASGGQGNSSYTYYYSLAGMAMRIS